MKFSGIYDIRLYKKQATEQFIVKKYILSNKTIKINEEKSNE